jgi:Domain of unknown function (DUF1906)
MARRVWRKHALATGVALATAALSVASVSASTYQAGSREATASKGITQGTLKRVTYRGYVFQVPQSWPVIDVSPHSTTCVRFDRHALYLGQPGATQACPSGLVGSTEALLVQPGVAQPQAQSLEDPVGHRITVTAPRIKLTATYSDDQAQILGILAAAGLPAPVAQNPAVMSPAQMTAGPTVATTATDGTGLGFDACAAPGETVMQAWLRHSHYQAIGIYIGGSDRACAQPNLTATWVSDEAAAGWHFIPLYVGPQVAFHGEVTKPVNQAIAAAQDAAVQARLLGFGPGTPIYYDMEAYPSSRTTAALKFFTAWTTELHTLGYRSAVYSSSDSGVSDLAANYTNSSVAVPDVIYDAWWNGVANTTDPNIGTADWANHQRVHQFAGGLNQRHGGYTINIDKDYMDVQLGAGPGTGGSGLASRQASQAVVTSGRVVDAFFTGADRALWYTRYRPGAGWSSPASLGGSLASNPSAVTDASGGAEVFYRAADGSLTYVMSSGSGWSSARVLRMGQLGSAPRAVSTGSGDIEVFWRGTDKSQLWSAEYTPGQGWEGPEHVAGGLKSAPSPVVSGTSTVNVFWKGTNGRLWHTSHQPGQAWRVPATVPVGRVGSAPRTTGQHSGEVDVFWASASRATVRHAAFTWGAGWGSPTHFGAGVTGSPVMVSAAASTERAFWRGSDGRLWQAVSRGDAEWHGTGPASVGHVGGGLFAVGQGNGVIDVFWRGSASHHLWHARYYPHSSTWTEARDLGGNVAP